jgi:ATP cone domain/Restriction endonuclease
MSGEVLITKASGEREPFSEAKLRRSLARSRAPEAVIDAAVREVRSELRDGMTTSDIYRLAFGLLRRLHRPTAARYSLKKAIMELGPTGHPFEKLTGEVLKAQGYAVEVAHTVQGRCVAHEVDVVGSRAGRHIMVECKFHNETGVKTDIKIALYVQARFEDIEKAWQSQAGNSQRFDEAWLVTNTKLTSEAIQYARCAGMQAVGWAYPAGGSLAELIEKANLQPVTSITSLSKAQKSRLLEAGIVLCRELLEKPQVLAGLGISAAAGARIMQEAEDLCRMSEL